MNRRTLWWACAVLPFLLVGVGCVGGDKPVKVEGMVTLDGKPLPEAMIVFNPEGGGSPASGVSGSDGSFRLTTFSSGDGAKPGSYKVTVALAKPADADGPQPESGNPQSMIDAMKKHAEAQKHKPAGPKKPSLPATYSDLSKTTLKYVIPPPDGKVTLELRSTGS
jgi:hypothetical protein